MYKFFIGKFYFESNLAIIIPNSMEFNTLTKQLTLKRSKHSDLLGAPTEFVDEELGFYRECRSQSLSDLFSL